MRQGLLWEAGVVAGASGLPYPLQRAPGSSRVTQGGVSGASCAAMAGPTVPTTVMSSTAVSQGCGPGPLCSCCAGSCQLPPRAVGRLPLCGHQAPILPVLYGSLVFCWGRW